MLTAAQSADGRRDHDEILTAAPVNLEAWMLRRCCNGSAATMATRSSATRSSCSRGSGTRECGCTTGLDAGTPEDTQLQRKVARRAKARELAAQPAMLLAADRSKKPSCADLPQRSAREQQ